MHSPLTLPADWRDVLPSDELDATLAGLENFLAAERARHTVFPPAGLELAALQATPFAAVRAVIVGQDPYHGAGQAHGLSFSVPHGEKLPPSLRNIFKELCADTGCAMPTDGCLLPWARQGVLLLNSVLTVRDGEPGSHQGIGWEGVTDAVLRVLNDRREPVAFVLWGATAQKKLALIDATRHVIITAPHPSPLSAHRGFFGSQPFSKINAALRTNGKSEIDWSFTAPTG